MQLVKYAFAFETLLKCLFHIPELAVLILTAKSGVLDNSLSSDEELIPILAKIISGTFQTPNKAIYISSIFSALSARVPYLCDGTQHDSHEVIAFLLQAIEEELLGARVPGSPIDNLYENASPREYQLWWDHYKRYNPTSITTLFYGYSITSTLCSHCHAHFSTLSAFNTLHIPLPLTQTRLNVNLVHQFLDLPTGHVSLRTEPISVKVGPSASLRDVRAAILASLASNSNTNTHSDESKACSLDIALLIGTATGCATSSSSPTPYVVRARSSR
ncbi:uncharacterized protein [Blastocystis hominis]|uniref:Peptidase C19 ubiquitin carboxyl-terminal hydrolase domain-containing protein n=1 Tax=Blastocystis hominis TaxID=12968 RepID=D8M0Y2_BLAHO|nr:uncharacterized protein [Blastocystis hominis]CBK21721.2 unnamed protein product [Blastocystis hominis]|eukprot:XP_012895769.1 uncharacterized protein [Blastocystis hominis]